MDTLVLISIAILAVIMLIMLVLLLIFFARKPQDISAIIAPLQGLTQAVGSVESELSILSERVSTVERDQTQVGQAVTVISTKLIETGTIAQGLADASLAIRSGLTSAQETLAALHSHATARQQSEQQTAESIKRLEAVIAGTKTKGTAGENIIDVVFSQLPAEWQVRNFQIGNKTVEFGLRLPNNLVLPIDSKWTATNLLEQFLSSEDMEQRQVLKSQIEKAVLIKAKEVRRYIDPSITVNFGIAAVPDAVFDLCSSVQVETLQLNVVLLSYSMFVPYLLLAFQTFLKTTHEIDYQKLAAYLETAQVATRCLQEELEGRLSRVVTMLSNSRDDMRSHLSKISTSLTTIQLGAGSPQETEFSPPSVVAVSE